MATEATKKLAEKAVGKEPEEDSDLDAFLGEAYRLDPADSPAVEILNAAEAYVLSQCAAIVRNAANVEARTAAASSPRVIWRTSCRRSATARCPGERHVVRRKQKMFAEAVLWLRLHTLEKGGVSADSFGRVQIGDLPKELQAYLVERFYRPPSPGCRIDLNTRNPGNTNGLDLPSTARRP